MLIAQISDVHVGSGRYRRELLRTAIDEINEAGPDLIVVAGDLTDEGYPDEFLLAAEELHDLDAPRVVYVPGNHDARNVGYLHFEDIFGARDSQLELDLTGLRDVARRSRLLEARPRRGRGRARALPVDSKRLRR